MTGTLADVDGGGHGRHAMTSGSGSLEQKGHSPGAYREDRLGTGRAPFTHLWERWVGSETARVLPDNQSDIIVASHGRAWLVGPATTADLPVLPEGTRLKGLRINTAWLSSIVGLHAAELTNREVALDDLFSASAVHRLIDALWGDRIDRELLGSLWPDVAVDARVDYAVAALTSKIAPPVTELADRMDLSPRHLRRLVERDTGLTPKIIHQVARLHHAIHDAAATSRAGLAQIAASNGYSDQAHLARDARQFSGLTPTALFERTSTPASAEMF